MTHCGFCGNSYNGPHDTLRCWYQRNVLTMDNIKMLAETEKLEYWWRLPSRERVSR